ncbi:VOC family protein [Candidatus Gracilibacteria bacterium]|nr:VOC family protein [Candidatus Gracilibacteria bacterium]
MKYGYTILYVKDVEATLGFYEQAFGFKKGFMTPECDYAEVVSGETTLAFASLELANSHLLKKGFTTSSLENPPFGIELAFITENLEADFETAKSMGAVEFEPIAEKPWGQKVGYLRDNNGFLIEMASPMSE